MQFGGQFERRKPAPAQLTLLQASFFKVQEHGKVQEHRHVTAAAASLTLISQPGVTVTSHRDGVL